MFIQTQTTPNPATLKFLPGCDVSPATPYEFISPEEASASPLASARHRASMQTGRSVFMVPPQLMSGACPGAGV